MKKKVETITDYQSYMDELKQYYIKCKGKISESDVSNFVISHTLAFRFNIGTNDVIRDLEEIKRTTNITSQTIFDNVLNGTKTITGFESYMELLKQYYSQYGEEAFLPSKIQDFIASNQLNSQMDIKLDDVMNDLLKISKAAHVTPVQTATSPKQPQRKQTTNNTPSAQSRQINTVNNTIPSENNTDTSFYSYVTNMSDTQLVNTINGQYKAIKGTWNAAPCMGEYGSIEFAAVLLLWRYAKVNFDRDQESYASLQVTLGDIIGCSFFGMPAGEWSDKKDPILNAHSDILTLKEFGSVYNYLRNNFVDEIHQMEFNNGNAKAEVYRQLYTQFVQVYNSMNGYPEAFSFYTSKGLTLENDIQSLDESSTESLLLKKWAWGNEDFMKAVFAFLLSQKWESCFKKLAEDAYVDIPPKLTDNFYSSSYSCPTCGRHMYKTVFPIGAESPIKVDNEVVLMKRIFTCPTCQTFYTPLSGRKLSYGMCYCLEAQTQYDLLLKIFDNQGTTDGRPDA